MPLAPFVQFPPRWCQHAWSRAAPMPGLLLTRRGSSRRCCAADQGRRGSGTGIRHSSPGDPRGPMDGRSPVTWHLCHVSSLFNCLACPADALNERGVQGRSRRRSIPGKRAGVVAGGADDRQGARWRPGRVASRSPPRGSLGRITGRMRAAWVAVNDDATADERLAYRVADARDRRAVGHAHTIRLADAVGPADVTADRESAAGPGARSGQTCVRRPAGRAGERGRAHL